MISTRALIGRSPIAFSRRWSQSGEGPFFTPRTSRPAKTGQASAVSLSNSSSIGIGLAKAPLTGLTVLLQLAETGGGEIARDAAHAEAVGPVRRDGDLDHRIVKAERGGGGAADLGLRIELDDAAMLVGQLKLALGQQHAVRLDAPDLGLGQREVDAGHVAPTGANTPFMPARAFGAPHTT